LLSWFSCAFKVTKPAGGWSGSKEQGITMIETVIGLAIIGLVMVAFLSGLATASRGTILSREQTTAESLVRSEIEYVRSCTYDYFTSTYPVDSGLTIPIGWVVPPPTVEPVHASDDGLQKVTVSAEHNGETILSIIIYKADR
jgi:type II secretory pathway pseudopilin PulG